MRVDVRDRRPLPWQLIVAAALLALLATLGTLQYRWLGEVSEAERQRMRAGLQTRAADFAEAFDRELTQIYVAFHGEPETVERTPAQAVGAALAKAQATATVPGLIRDVFLLEAQGASADVLQRYDPGAGALRPSEWPAPLEAWRARASHDGPLKLAGVLPIFIADAMDARLPALIIPIPQVKRVAGIPGGQFAVVPEPGGTARAFIVWLDGDRLRQQLLEPLVAKYFGAGEQSEYLVTIVQREDPSTIVYTSANNAIVDEHADVSTGMFDLRMNDITRVTGPVAPPAASGLKTLTDRIAVTIVRRAAPGDAARLTGGGATHGAWLVRARYRSGSLESIVASSRRRNLAISIGVLGLLAGAFTLILAAAQRQRRLARQQMEFVAAVSHELRTPLAVICSAGENLADGVVADAAQIKTYGSLIENEGRRLGDMVERVMEFAGISSGAPIRARGGVDVAAIAADAVQFTGVEARAGGVTVTLHVEGTVPMVTADATALHSAVQNIVGNAVKYSRKGGTVDVSVRAVGGGSGRSVSDVQQADADGVEIRVADRGLGIDAEDLPHIFQPFFRGRRAVDAQVRGTGVGLSVVRHAVAAHHGTIAVDSRVGEGTVVTVTLPIAVSANAPSRSGTSRVHPSEQSDAAIRTVKAAE